MLHLDKVGDTDNREWFGMSKSPDERIKYLEMVWTRGKIDETRGVRKM